MADAEKARLEPNMSNAAPRTKSHDATKADFAAGECGPSGCQKASFDSEERPTA